MSSSSSSQQRDMKDIISPSHRHFLLRRRRWRWVCKTVAPWHLEIIGLSQRAELQTCASSWLCFAKLTRICGVVSRKMGFEDMVMMYSNYLWSSELKLKRYDDNGHKKSKKKVQYSSFREYWYICHMWLGSLLVWCRGRFSWEGTVMRNSWEHKVFLLIGHSHIVIPIMRLRIATNVWDDMVFKWKCTSRVSTFKDHCHAAQSVLFSDQNDFITTHSSNRTDTSWLEYHSNF